MINTQRNREDIFFKIEDVKGKARPRHNRRTGIVYTPKSTKEYESHIQNQFIQACNKLGRFYLEKPKRVYAELIIFKKNPLTKPDIDNIQKAIFDALNKLAYDDDSQITTCLVKKRQILKGNNPCVFVYLTEDDNEYEYVYLTEDNDE